MDLNEQLRDTLFIVDKLNAYEVALQLRRLSLTK